ncbi:alpha/beta fold hydrolase [Streptomyces sp. NPDC005494]|uniref:alpha/beta fold hydrolase n=1 Tax=Streptomyces sp. NPDC005494 TaxID=3364715 RepID=UPI0036B6263C
MHVPTRVPPTVVLVHGAFTDASSWAAVAGLLHSAGLRVRAPANPLRGLRQDSAYIRSVVRDIAVPVVLVGHGYGGAVITHAAADNDNVVALCYVAAFGLDARECVLDITRRFAPMPSAYATVTAPLPARSPGSPESELYIRRTRFADVFAADLPPRVSRVLAVTQRPIASSALTGVSGPPAWASKPSWYAIATADQLLNPTAQHFMAQRMAAAEHLLDGSHAVLLSQPGAVTGMIREAVAHGSAPVDGDEPPEQGEHPIQVNAPRA